MPTVGFTPIGGNHQSGSLFLMYGEHAERMTSPTQKLDWRNASFHRLKTRLEATIQTTDSNVAWGQPLAPDLYQALRDVFGDVRINKQRERAVFTAVTSPRGDDSRMHDPGELYVFCCPWCGDTRRRAWVSHMWGQPNPVTGYPMRSLGGCWNEDCFKGHKERWHDFEMVLLGALPLGAIGPVDPSGVEPRVAGCLRMPGWIVPLDDLSDDHVAVRYIVGRGFEPGHLVQHYDAGYCMGDDPAFPVALGRIVVPIFHDGKRVGWQARRLDERDTFGKYYTMPGFKTSLHIYGWDRMSQSDTIVLVEGVTDVWSVGDRAGALFGKHLKDGQLQLLRALAPKQPVVVLLFDKDAIDEITKAWQQLVAMFPGRVVVAALPDDVRQVDCRTWPIGKVDPGVLKTSVLDNLIQSAIRQQTGVPS